MISDCSVISYVGMKDPVLFNWTFLFSKRVILPFTNIEFDTWLQCRKLANNSYRHKLLKWIMPMEDFGLEANIKGSPLDYDIFCKQYNKHPAISYHLEPDDEFFRLTNLIRIALAEEVVLSMVQDEYNVLGQLTNVAGRPTSDRLLNNICHMLFPAIDFLPFHTIEKLRSSAFIDSFCEAIEKLMDSSQQQDKELHRKLLAGLLELAGDVSPKIRETSLLGVAANLPSPIIVNPVGVISSIRDVRKSVQLKKTHGWLFFLSEMAQQLRPYSNDSGKTTAEQSNPADHKKRGG